MSTEDKSRFNVGFDTLGLAGQKPEGFEEGDFVLYLLLSTT